MRPGVRDPIEMRLVGQKGIDQARVVRVAGLHVLPGISVGRAAVGVAARAVGIRLVSHAVSGARALTVEGELKRNPCLLLPIGHVSHVGRAHLDVSRHAWCGARGHSLNRRRAGVVGRIDGCRGALVLRAPLVVGDERVVDVLAEIVAVQAQVRVLSDPVDEPGSQQQPLRLVGVVVEIERELGDAGVWVLVDPGHRVAGGVGEERRIGRARVDRRSVPVGTGIEGDRAFELAERGQSGAGEHRCGAVERAARRVGDPERRGRVHVPVDLAYAEGGLVAGERCQCARRIVPWRIRDDDAVVVARAAAGQRGQADRLVARRPRSVDERIGNPLAVQRGTPRGRGHVCRPLADQQDLHGQLLRTRNARGCGGQHCAARRQNRHQSRCQRASSQPETVHRFPRWNDRRDRRRAKPPNSRSADELEHSAAPPGSTIMRAREFDCRITASSVKFSCRAPQALRFPLNSERCSQYWLRNAIAYPATPFPTHNARRAGALAGGRFAVVGTVGVHGGTVHRYLASCHVDTTASLGLVTVHARLVIEGGRSA